jgi:hypothetical protein
MLLLLQVRMRPGQVFLATWKGTPVAVKQLILDNIDTLATLGSPTLDTLRAVRATLTLTELGFFYVCR